MPYDGSTFQPGFIVKYKDGRLGIFDINNKKDKVNGTVLLLIFIGFMAYLIWR